MASSSRLGADGQHPANLSRVRQELAKTSRCSGLPGGLRLKPPAHGRFVGQVLGGKSCLEIALLSGYDHERHKCDRGDEGNDKPEATDPQRESKLEQGEGEVDGIAAEAIGACSDDRRGGSVAGDRRAGGAQRANGEDEDDKRRDDCPTPDRRAESGWGKPDRPSEVKGETENDGTEIHERRPRQPDVRDPLSRTCLNRAGFGVVFQRGWSSKTRMTRIGSIKSRSQSYHLTGRNRPTASITSTNLANSLPLARPRSDCRCLPPRASLRYSWNNDCVCDVGSCSALTFPSW